jgi:phosphate transport system permease protein
VITRRLRDLVASKLMLSATIFSCSIVFIIAFVLVQKSMPILTTRPLGQILLSSSWHPWNGEFGFLAFIAGTLWVTMIAIALALPSSVLTAIYLAEYAPSRIRGIIMPMIDLLAGIPSVIYGLWGVIFVAPLIRDRIAPLAGVTTTGYTVLTGGIVLAIMVFPIIIFISEEVIRAVPQDIREASLSLGATKWQTTKHAVLRSALPGIIAATILGFGRAFGETMAVLMVVGNVPKVPSSIFDPGYPLPALIANNYGEMMSIPSFDSALMLAALILLFLVLMFSVLAGLVLVRAKRRYAIG